MDLTALADFNAVAQHGGFAAAARKLDRPKATLSRRVAELEQSLGVRLIERGARTLRLTDEGRMLNEQTRGLLAEIAEAGETIASRASAPRGRLRVSAPIVYAHVALPRVASRFARAYPQVELEIVAEDRMTDPVEDGYDLVIRVNPNADELLVGRRVATDRAVRGSRFSRCLRMPRRCASRADIAVTGRRAFVFIRPDLADSGEGQEAVSGDTEAGTEALLVADGA